MNIFYLDNNVSLCAQYHVDKHMKMIVESMQLLSTAHRVLDGNNNVLPDERNDNLYKCTHKNHPCAIWVRESDEHYLWLFRLSEELLKEYTFRYEKNHASSRLIPYLKNLPNNICKNGFVEPPQAMPEEYKVSGDSVSAYRNYYFFAKSHITKWKNRDVPKWFSIMCLDELTSTAQEMGFYK